MKEYLEEWGKKEEEEEEEEESAEILLSIFLIPRCSPLEVWKFFLRPLRRWQCFGPRILPARTIARVVRSWKLDISPRAPVSGCLFGLCVAQENWIILGFDFRNYFRILGCPFLQWIQFMWQSGTGTLWDHFTLFLCDGGRGNLDFLRARASGSLCSVSWLLEESRFLDFWEMTSRRCSHSASLSHCGCTLKRQSTELYY